MRNRTYSLEEVKEIISIAQRGKNLLRYKRHTESSYDLLVQTLQRMEKYPLVFGKEDDEDSRYGILSMLEDSIKEHFLPDSLPF